MSKMNFIESQSLRASRRCAASRGPRWGLTRETNEGPKAKDYFNFSGQKTYFKKSIEA